MTFALHGLPVSQGIAIGHVHLISHALLEVNHYLVQPRHLPDELARLDDAVATVQGELVGLKAAATSGQTHSEVGAFVDLQLMMLADPLLIDSALEQPKAFVHRDYHSRNLMIVPGQTPGIIDFQDAVVGPVTYDLVSLLRDC